MAIYDYIAMDKSSELYHYGVKGMKWGVRNDYVPVGRNHSGSSTIRSTNNSSRISGHVSSYSKRNTGKSIISKWQSTAKSSKSNKKFDKRKAIRNALFGIAAVSAATVVGLEVYKLGKMNADTILRKGTLAQSVAISEKTDWGKSFYAATGQDDRRKILKSFSKITAERAKKQGLSGTVNANMFTNDHDVRIAGRKAMKRAYKKIYGTTRGYHKFEMSFGAKDEATRQPFLKELQRQGYGGFKDIDGMAKWWGGSTPVVLNGSDSGFKLRNTSKINVERAVNVPVKDIGTKLRNIEEHGIKAATGAAIAGVGAQTVITAGNVRKKRGGRKNGK